MLRYLLLLVVSLKLAKGWTAHVKSSERHISAEKVWNAERRVVVGILLYFLT
jgi:hypothetical protein